MISDKQAIEALEKLHDKVGAVKLSLADGFISVETDGCEFYANGKVNDIKDMVETFLNKYKDTFKELFKDFHVEVSPDQMRQGQFYFISATDAYSSNSYEGNYQYKGKLGQDLFAFDINGDMVYFRYLNASKLLMES